jgi:repressor LexA
MTETTTPPPLTDRQQAILDYVRDNTQAASPTCRQIAEAFGFKSPHAVTVHLNALERKGKIRRTPGRSRNIEVIA